MIVIATMAAMHKDIRSVPGSINPKISVPRAAKFQLKNKNNDIEMPCLDLGAKACNNAMAAPNHASPTRYPNTNDIIQIQNDGVVNAVKNGTKENMQLRMISLASPDNP